MSQVAVEGSDRLGSIQFAFAPEPCTASVRLHLAAPMPLSAGHRSGGSTPSAWAQCGAALTATILAAAVVAKRHVRARNRTGWPRRPTTHPRSG